MKKSFLLLVCAIFLIGCKQTSEHIILNDDGSGTLEVNVFFPQATLNLFDLMFGEQAAQIQQEEDFEAPEGVEKLTDLIGLGYSEKNLKAQAKTVGLNIEMLDFQEIEHEDGLQVFFKIAFDDIDKLSKSSIMAKRVKLTKNQDGVWTGSIIQNVEKEKDTKAQIANYKNFQNSEKFTSLEENEQEAILAAMDSFQYSITITLPNHSVVNTTQFSSVDDNSVALSYYGNLLEDKAIIDKISGKNYRDALATWVKIEEPEEETQ